MRDVFRILSVVLFPGEKCRDGIVLSCEAFFFRLIKLCYVSWLACCLYVEDTADVTATIVRLLCGFINTRKTLAGQLNGRWLSTGTRFR